MNKLTQDAFWLGINRRPGKYRKYANNGQALEKVIEQQ